VFFAFQRYFVQQVRVAARTMRRRVDAALH
jgi:hypothetical protein